MSVAPGEQKTRPRYDAVLASIVLISVSIGTVGSLLSASAAAPSLPTTPVFRSPVVPGAEISGYFDHDEERGSVVFYDGRRSDSGAGFYFSCPEVGGSQVGCAVEANSEAGCPDEQELWYDNHHGIDYEYANDWRTGDACDRERFAGITREVYAPAAGLVTYVGYGRFNGNFIIVSHDVDGNGDYYNDGLRSFYLHFADGGIAVTQGQVLMAGDLLGTGGSTGLSWTPHLHFEVQRYVEGAWRSVDPYGWLGANEDDPWPYDNYPLWQEATPAPPEAAGQTYMNFPFVLSSPE